MSETKQRSAAKGAVALFTILVLGAALGNLSQTALNAMMHTVIADFGLGVDVGQWLTTIYMLSLGIAVPLTSHLTKRMGMYAYTLMSLGIFVAGAFLDAVAPGFLVLVLGRVCQAVSAGFMMPVMQSVAMRSFPPERQGAVMGIAGIAMGFAPNIGPTIGSLFAQGLGWRWFFVLLAVLPAVLAIIAFFKVPRGHEAPQGEVKLELGSFVLSAIGFGGILSGLSLSSSQGLASWGVWVPLAIGAVVLFLFMRRQRHVGNPLINLDIFKSHSYKTGFWLQNLLFGSFMGITLVIPLYIQGPLGGTAVESGIVLLPGAITALIFNPLAGWVADKIGKCRVMRIAAVIYAIGALLPLMFNETTPLWTIALFQAIRGMGVSSSMGSTITWLLHELPRPIMNDGSSFTVLVRQACASLGTAVMVFVITVASSDGGMLGYLLAFGFSGILSIIMLVMAFAGTRGEDC